MVSRTGINLYFIKNKPDLTTNSLKLWIYIWGSKEENIDTTLSWKNQKSHQSGAAVNVTHMWGLRAFANSNNYDNLHWNRHIDRNLRFFFRSSSDLKFESCHQSSNTILKLQGFVISMSLKKLYY